MLVDIDHHPFSSLITAKMTSDTSTELTPAVTKEEHRTLDYINSKSLSRFDSLPSNPTNSSSLPLLYWQRRANTSTQR